MNTRIALAALLGAAIVGVANAEFAPGNFVGASGLANGSSIGAQDTGWGTAFNQGPHQLGTTTTFWDAVYGTDYPVFVSSTVVDPFSVIFTIDFTQFASTDYTHYSFDITGLKSDQSIIGASGLGYGVFSTDGNSVHWDGTIGDLLAAGDIISFKVYQEPAPGALALLGMAGIVGGRRRRNS